MNFFLKMIDRLLETHPREPIPPHWKFTTRPSERRFVCTVSHEDSDAKYDFDVYGDTADEAEDLARLKVSNGIRAHREMSERAVKPTTEPDASSCTFTTRPLPGEPLPGRRFICSITIYGKWVGDEYADTEEEAKYKALSRAMAALRDEVKRRG